MTQAHSIESLAQRLEQTNLPFPKHFARALVALLTARKISLHHIANLMPGDTNPEANRMQLRRCLDHKSQDPDAWAMAIAALLPEGKWVLALDRTQWERGETCVNLLVLSVVAFGSAVPILWTVMPDEGASDTTERIELMGRFVDLFGSGRWEYLTADREFIGGEWVGWLLAKGLDFRIRVKAGERLESKDGRERTGREWFLHRACGCKRGRMRLWGHWVYVGGKRLRNGQYLVVIGNNARNLLSDYRRRWKIETLFQALKGRGFDLESCRLSRANRLSGWFGFVSLGFCWCLLAGAMLDAVEPAKVKKHGRRATSCFRRGLDWLARLLCCLAGRPSRREFDRALALLEPSQNQFASPVKIPAL